MEFKTLTLTYIQNNYVSLVEFNRCALYQITNRLAILRINSNVSAMPHNTEVKIASLPFHVYDYSNFIAHAQGSPAHFNVAVSGTNIQLANYSGIALGGWVRVPLVLFK